MVILRPTLKLAKALAPTAVSGVESDTALGDWYVNRVVIKRRPILILVSSRSLLAILASAQDVRSLPARLPKMVAERLARLGIHDGLIASEIAVMSPVMVERTANRSVTGIMVDVAHFIEASVEMHGWDGEHVFTMEAALARTPYFASKREEDVIFPKDAVPRLLQERWGGRARIR